MDEEKIVYCARSDVLLVVFERETWKVEMLPGLWQHQNRMSVKYENETTGPRDAGDVIVSTCTNTRDKNCDCADFWI